MSDDALLDAVTRRWEMLQSAWTTYLVVCAGVLALVVALPRLRDDRRALQLLGVAFAFFAVTHLLGLLYTLKQWGALAAQFAATQSPAVRGAFAESGLVEAPHPLWVLPFHLLGDALVLGGLWRLGRPAAR